MMIIERDKLDLLMPLSFITSLVEIEVGEQSHSGC